ncbi:MULTISPECIES: DUF805 domain-containing protein [unclassified Massilia]|uniref:DUF805 domain-containing protein n=1 Tax=unclassified Massilia TaxID=2609279 RepID=UPI001B83AECF|nr:MULTISPECIES: DUF805 domain-containing protein [unclassified Massilia]MBQ5941959.1 DUF805 domain-containing protein [Massilia sp. AB1]MBQ5962675.1 DUF805 domain-containing protein [Massilia sp. ZL223]
MTFTESISTCFRKYATFEGTASRSEYWWFWLFLVLVSVGLNIVSEQLSAIFSLATLLPSIAAGARRLHDTDRSGWWQLLMFLPVVGWIVLLVFEVQEGRPNRYEVQAVAA